MDGIIMRSLAGVLAVGLTMWGPMPLALAQVEITQEVRQACERFDPEIRDIALTEVVPKLEESNRADASPEAKAEAKIVEKTATVIRETTETTKKAVENPEVMAKNAREVLAKSGVPTEVAGKVEQQMKDAFTKARDTLSRGGTLDDAAKYFEAAKSAMSECSGYMGGKDFKEALAGTGPTGIDRGEYRAMEFMGAVMDPKARDTMEAAMKAHFEGAIREGGSSIGTMKDMMEKMATCGINPREIQIGGRGEFHGPSPEAIAAMSPNEKVMFDAWKSGDMDKMMAQAKTDAYKAGIEAGVSPEAMARELSHMTDMMTVGGTSYRDATTSGGTMETMYREYTSPTQDAPRTETSGTTVTTYERYADGHATCPAGKAHVLGAADGTPQHCI